MKKLLPVLLTILTCGAAYALPVGNPSEASLFTTGVFWDGGCCDPCDPCFSWCDAWSLRVGFYGDYVFNRHMHNESSDLNKPHILWSELYTSAGYLALNFCDRVDIFTSLGSTTFSATGDESSIFGGTSSETNPLTLAYEPTFSWSIGARATLWECNCFAFGLEGQYFRTNPRPSMLIDWSDQFIPQRSDDLKHATYREWQVGLGVSYRLASQCPSVAMVPYMAVKWAGSKMSNHEINSDNQIGTTPPPVLAIDDYKSDKTWGYAVGSSFTLCDVIGFTVEGRFGDEKAFYVNGQFRF